MTLIPIRLRVFIASLSIIGLLSPWLLPLFNQYNRYFWLVDLIVHWQWLYVIGLAISALLLLSTDKRYALLLTFLALPWLSAATTLPSGSSSKKLTIASANVHVSTQKVTALKQWLALHNPQIVIVLEVSNALKKELAALEQYPYQIVEASDSPFGIALLSTLPILKSEIIYTENDTVHIDADVNFYSKPISIYAFHPMPPLSPHFHQSRDEQLSIIATKIQARKLPAVIAGDFNATPWSSAFGAVTASHLKHTNIFPTWPDWGAKIIGIPIDHIVATHDWLLTSHEVGEAIGSDHFPVIATLSLIN